MSRKNQLLWLLAGLLSVVVTVLIFLPATWLGAIVEQQTKGRISLGDPQGSFWSGSAFIASAPNGDAPVTPLFPGRFSWKISPRLLVGTVLVEIDNPDALKQKVVVKGGVSQWEVSGSTLMLPSERLEGLGSPLNVIGPSGRLQLTWNSLQIDHPDGNLALIGAIYLDMFDMASRITPVKPLGSFRLSLDWRGENADVGLSTLHGPLLLNGKGYLKNGRLQFSGTATAEAGQEDRLANLLNLLGQRRRDGDKEVTALEFK